MSFFKAFGNCSYQTNYNWNHNYLHVPQLFQLSSKIQVFVNFFTFFHFHLFVWWNSKIHKMTNSYLLVYLTLSLVFVLRFGDLSGSQNPREFYALHFLWQILTWAYNIFFVWSNFNPLHNSQLITFPTQSCLVLYSFRSSLLPSFMSLTVSSLGPHNRYFLLLNFRLDYN